MSMRAFKNMWTSQKHCIWASMIYAGLELNIPWFFRQVYRQMAWRKTSLVGPAHMSSCQSCRQEDISGHGNNITDRLPRHHQKQTPLVQDGLTRLVCSLQVCKGGSWVWNTLVNHHPKSFTATTAGCRHKVRYVFIFC